jgi:Fibronectin type III-like domain
VYVRPPADHPAGAQFAVRALAQFDRIRLAPGRTKTVTLHVAPRQLSYWTDTSQRWVLDTRGRTFYVGDADTTSHSSGIRIEGSTVNGNVTVHATRQASDPLSSGTNVICNDTITGTLSVDSSTGEAPWNIGLCGPNTIDRNLVFDDNAATTSAISGNTIGRNLVCSGNGGVTGGPNRVAGKARRQCASVT